MVASLRPPSHTNFYESIGDDILETYNKGEAYPDEPDLKDWFTEHLVKK